jgi:hypothetical protein
MQHADLLQSDADTRTGEPAQEKSLAEGDIGDIRYISGHLPGNITTLTSHTSSKGFLK